MENKENSGKLKDENKAEETSSNSLSMGKMCSAWGCSEKLYKRVKEGGKSKRVRSDRSFFHFPEDRSRINHWCSLIKRRNGADNFHVTLETVVCDKHFKPEFVYRAPGSKRKKLLQGAKPILGEWNDYQDNEPKSRRSLFRSVSTPLSRKTLNLPSQNECSSIQGQGVNELTEKMADTDSVSRNETGKEQEFRCLNTICNEKLSQLKSEISRLQSVIEELKDENRKLKEENSFINHVLSSDEKCKHYTGFITTGMLMSTFNYLDAGENGENIIMYNPSTCHQEKVKGEKRGRKRALKPLDQFIITLVRARQSMSIIHLSWLTGKSESNVSTVIITWINYMFLKLGSISIWPSRDIIKQIMPESMREKFPSVRCIIDCLEIFTETPSSLPLHKVMFSEYKHNTTWKCLVGIAPGGGFTFVSSLFPGSTSDKEIVSKSGILHPRLWEKGDAIMADRGFTIQTDVEPLGIELIIPAFLDGRDQLSEEETILTQQIASERIHVERMIQRLKSFHIFDSEIPVRMFGSINQLVTVCAMLCNLQDPIIATPMKSACSKF